MGVFHHKKPIITDGLVFSVDGANKISSFQTDTRAASFTQTTSAFLNNFSSDLNQTGSFSCGGWFYVTSTTTGVIISQWAKTDNSGWEILSSGSGTAWTLYYYEDGSLRNTPGNTVSLNTWHFGVIVHDISTKKMKFSVDGASFVEHTYTGSYTPSTSDSLTLNGRGSENNSTVLPVAHRADNVFYYDKTLSLSEIQDLYKNGEGVNYQSLSTSQKTNLISWWNLNENGEKRVDSHGTNDLNEAVTSGGVGFNTGKVSEYDFFYARNMKDLTDGTPQNGVELINNSWEFDGVNDYILTDIPEFGPFIEGTFEVWIKANSFSGTWNGILGSGGINWRWAFNSNTMYLIYESGGSSTKSSVGNSFSTNTWYHFVFTNDGLNNVGSIKFFVNAQQLSLSTDTANSGNFSLTSTSIGRAKVSAPVYYLDGSISSVKYYNRALSAQEIKNNYDTQKYRFI